MTNTARLAAIRKLPCCKCGTTEGIQAAHINFGEHGKGRGIKADDSYTITLCHACHESFDCKRRFLTKIYMRDDAEYAATCAAVIGLKGVGEPEKFRLIADFVIDNTSTTDATTE